MWSLKIGDTFGGARALKDVTHESIQDAIIVRKCFVTSFSGIIFFWKAPDIYRIAIIGFSKLDKQTFCNQIEFPFDSMSQTSKHTLLHCPPLKS